MAAIHMHEFMALNGVIDTQTWTANTASTPDGRATCAATRRVAEAFCLGAPLSKCSQRRGRPGPSRTIRGRRSSMTP